MERYLGGPLTNSVILSGRWVVYRYVCVYIYVHTYTYWSALRIFMFGQLSEWMPTSKKNSVCSTRVILTPCRDIFKWCLFTIPTSLSSQTRVDQFVYICTKIHKYWIWVCEYMYVHVRNYMYIRRHIPAIACINLLFISYSSLSPGWQKTGPASDSETQ